MKYIFSILLLIPLLGCKQPTVSDLNCKKDKKLVDSLYGPTVWTTYFKAHTTSYGKTIRLKIINDSCYIIQWGDSLRLRTYPDTFKLDGHETRIPKLITENKDFIVLEQGCGNPCWTGYFLPTFDSLEPLPVYQYLDFDLDNNLVAYIEYPNIIEIINLKTNSTEIHTTGECTSAYLGYCIDSLSIRNKTLKYKWVPSTTINSDSGQVIIEKIKI